MRTASGADACKKYSAAAANHGFRACARWLPGKTQARLPSSPILPPNAPVGVDTSVSDNSRCFGNGIDRRRVETGQAKLPCLIAKNGRYDRFPSQSHIQ